MPPRKYIGPDPEWWENGPGDEETFGMPNEQEPDDSEDNQVYDEEGNPTR